MGFELKKSSGLDYLQNSVVAELGVVHGFGFNWHMQVAEARTTLSDAFGKAAVFLPVQVHGDHVAKAPIEPSCQADALLAERGLSSPSIVAIRTADCVPVMFFSKRYVTIVHAGWRGLAAGILESALAHDESFSHALVGPCARACCYEVGPEVVTALDLPRQLQAFAEGDRCMLDLQEIARYRISRTAPGMHIETAGICTICDSRFASFRRDKGDERNISFILV